MCSSRAACDSEPVWPMHNDRSRTHVKRARGHSGARQMRKQILTTAAILIGCAAATSAAAVDIGADTKVGGQIFFDVSHISLQNENSSGAKIDAAPTGTGFDVKRFYL